MSRSKKEDNPTFVDSYIAYELSKKDLCDRIQWLNTLDQESWYTIKHIINDYKKLEKNSVDKISYQRDFKKLEDENSFLKSQAKYMRKQLHLQAQAISTLQHHIALMTGKSQGDILKEMENLKYIED